jgi:hypothetical protein
MNDHWDGIFSVRGCFRCCCVSFGTSGGGMGAEVEIEAEGSDVRGVGRADLDSL